MWGRLDGAERVIAALLTTYDKALRDRLTQQVHRAIIVEEMMSEDAKASADLVMQRVVWDALDHWDNRERRNEFLSRAAGMLPSNTHIENIQRRWRETLIRSSCSKKGFARITTSTGSSRKTPR